MGGIVDDRNSGGAAVELSCDASHNVLCNKKLGVEKNAKAEAKRRANIEAVAKRCLNINCPIQLYQLFSCAEDLVPNLLCRE